MPQTTDKPATPDATPPAKGTRTLTDIWDDPKFRNASPDVQKAVLGKLGVSSDRVDKLMAKLSAKPAATPTPSAPAAPVPGFLSRVSSRVAGGLSTVNEAITKTIAATEPHSPEHKELMESLSRLGKPTLASEAIVNPPWATGPVSKTVAGATITPRAIAQTGAQLVGPMAKDWFKDPANLAGDILTMYMLGHVGTGEGAGTRTSASAEPRLVSPREIPAPGPGIDSPTGYPHGLSGEQWTEYVDKTNRAYHEHMQDVADYASKESRRRAKWAQDAYGATDKIADQVAATNRRNILKRGAREYTTLSQQNIRDVHQTVRSRLDSGWNTFRENMAGSTVDATEVGKVIQEAQGKLKGSPADLKLFNDLLRESGVEVDDTGSIVMRADAEPNMPVDTLRVHSSAMGDKLASGNLPGNVYQALKLAKEGSEGLIEGAADARGQGEFYRQLKRSWSQYMRDWRTTGSVAGGRGSPLANALATPDPTFLQGVITGKGGDILLETLGKYRDAGANPDLITSARSLSRQAAEVKVPKGAATEIPGTIRDRMQSAGVAKYEPSAPPKLKEVPLPKPEPPKVSGKKPFWKKVARTTAGVTTSATASAAGIHHPIATYVAGAEAGELLYDKATDAGRNVPRSMRGPQGTPETVPPPPAQVPADIRSYTGDWQPASVSAPRPMQGAVPPVSGASPAAEPEVESVRRTRGVPGKPPSAPGQNMVPPEMRASSEIARAERESIARKMESRGAAKQAMEKEETGPEPATEPPALSDDEKLRRAWGSAKSVTGEAGNYARVKESMFPGQRELTDPQVQQVAAVAKAVTNRMSIAQARVYLAKEFPALNPLEIESLVKQVQALTSSK